jgi:hypothetical protein
MAWIQTIRPEDDPKVAEAMAAPHAMYPREYAEPVPSVDTEGAAGIVAVHSLIPEALRHSFATFGALMSPELPLSRRQHEMITTVVSLTNRCHY